MRPLQVGDLAVTLPRINPANAGRVVYLKDYTPADPALGITDAFLIVPVDGERFAETVTHFPDGQTAHRQGSKACWCERRYLRPLDEVQDPVPAEAIGGQP